MFGLPTIKSGSTYGTDKEPLGLPMNKRQWAKYEETKRQLESRKDDA